MALIDSYAHPRDVIRDLRDNAVPRWIQDLFLGSLPNQAFSRLAEFSGRPFVDRLSYSCFIRLSQDGVWMYSEGGRTVIADLIRGRVIDAAALPRRTKKALATPVKRRTPQQRRLVARISVGALGRWSGGFRVDDALDLVPFDGELQNTFDDMAALMDGDSLINPSSLFGGMKYAVLSELTDRGHLSYKEAYERVSQRFGCDERLEMPMGSYDYDLLFHWAWKDIAFKVRRAAHAVASNPAC